MPTLRAAPPGLIVAALGLGLAADSLFRAPVWGLNVTVFVASLAAWGIHAGRRADPPLAGFTLPWLGACGFAVMWVIRDEPQLLAFDLLAALCLLALPVLATHGIALRSAGALDLLATPPLALRQAVAGGARALFQDVPWTSFGGPDRRVLRGTLAGLLVSLPVLGIFGGLFASADPTFGAAVSSLFRWDPGLLVGHVVGTGAATWITAGWLRGFVVRGSADPIPRLNPGAGALPVGIALAAMVLVFTLFVAVQAGNLFRGEAYVLSRVGLTFAEYARGGFFQLVAASVLALPIVYAATWAAGDVDAGAARSLRALQAVALGLDASVALSALWRMRLYVDAYGLSLDRLYATAIIVWIGATVAVFARTVLRGRPKAGARGAVVAAAVVLGLLNAVNPAALIARVNLERPGGRAVDLAHLASLGADAVPVIAQRFTRLTGEERCTLVAKVMERRSVEASGDWRGWNAARSEARRTVEVLRLSQACPEREVSSAPATPSPAR